MKWKVTLTAFSHSSSTEQPLISIVYENHSQQIEEFFDIREYVWNNGGQRFNLDNLAENNSWLTFWKKILVAKNHTLAN